MERDYVIVDGVATVAEALEVLREGEAHVLMVAKRHPDDEFGIVMVDDIAKQVLARNRSPERTNVYEIMSKPALSGQRWTSDTALGSSIASGSPLRPSSTAARSWASSPTTNSF
jgi:hypothetical protein